MKIKKIITSILSAIIFSSLLLTAPSAYAAQQKVGDTNNDGKINILDTTLIQKSLAEILSPNDKYNKQYADFDRNGTVDIMDATLIQKYIANMVIIYNSCLFEVNGNSASLLLYYGHSANFSVPGYISAYGYNVKSVSQNAFKNNATIATVTLPEQVTKLYDYAFYNCKNLTTIYAKNSKLSWGKSFVNCPKFQSIKFI